MESVAAIESRLRPYRGFHNYWPGRIHVNHPSELTSAISRLFLLPRRGGIPFEMEGRR